MGKSSKPQTTTQKTELPEWVQTEAQRNLRIADELASRPYQAYGGATVAGFAPEQEQAFQLAQANLGAYRPALTAATGAATQGALYQPQQVTAPSFLSGNIQSYMNPYLQEVEQRAGDALGRQLAQTQNQIASQAVQARAFGGSRQGIQEGVAAGEAARAMGDLSARLRSEGFGQAAALQQADQARQMQAALANQQAGLAGAGLGLQSAGVLGNLAQQTQQAGMADVGAISAVGGQRQALEQQQLQDAYRRFTEQRDYPLQQLNLRLAALGATPYGQTTTQTATGQQGSSLLTGLGGAGSAMAGAAQFLPVVMSMFSDRTGKTDIKKIGKDEETGINIYSYRYKGDPKTYPKMVGPMAQEIEKKYPDKVSEIAGRKVVDGNFLMGMIRK